VCHCGQKCGVCPPWEICVDDVCENLCVEGTSVNCPHGHVCRGGKCIPNVCVNKAYVCAMLRRDVLQRCEYESHCQGEDFECIGGNCVVRAFISYALLEWFCPPGTTHQRGLCMLNEQFCTGQASNFRKLPHLTNPFRLNARLKGTYATVPALAAFASLSKCA